MEELTKKQKGFVKDYVETGNGTEAALNNYDIEGKNKENVAASIASENLTKPNIVKAIESIAERIPDDLLVEKHLELLTVPKKVRTYIRGDLTSEYEEVDSNAIGKGLDMAYKIKGTYAPEKIQQTNVNINLTPQALAVAKKYEEELNKIEDGK